MNPLESIFYFNLLIRTFTRRVFDSMFDWISVGSTYNKD